MRKHTAQQMAVALGAVTAWVGFTGNRIRDMIRKGSRPAATHAARRRGLLRHEHDNRLDDTEVLKRLVRDGAKLRHPSLRPLMFSVPSSTLECSMERAATTILFSVAAKRVLTR
jgi:hypothetical protein